MDHRRVQRTLFRMQLDPGFASRLRGGDADASRGLEPDELMALRTADPRAVAADRDGKRRAQFLANVSSEFPLSLAAGLVVEGFPSSTEFHDALRADASLPFAFARYALRCSGERATSLAAMIALETALLRARRKLRSVRALKPGEVSLAPWAWLVTDPGGTLALATNLRTALDRGATLPAIALPHAPDEVLLLLADPEPLPFRLREVEVEALSPALGELLLALREPRPRCELARDADEIVDQLLADRVLIAGFAPAANPRNSLRGE